MFVKFLALPLTLLAAAPGEPSPASGDVRAAVVSTLARRFADNARPQLKGLVIKPDKRMAGYVACGEVGPKAATRYQKFFVMVPGGLAVLESDDRDLLARYWSLNGC
ncbi:hypothetical protein SAMN05519104_2157 [Rhizobiales bacterium GAS188]|nr:hypothetical protein SAMN05519104_2157 [Rhizobiales bacterium GAS188]